MTQVLTIPTPFADVSELTDNFAQRVDEERLMLPHSEPMPEGEWVQFSVLLGDGSVALAGVGRIQGSFDNGEEHPPEYRFDVVLESLQLEGMHEVMFERLLVARTTAMGGEPVTGEVSIEELEQQAAAAAARAEPEAGAETSDAGAWAEAPVAEPHADESYAAESYADESYAAESYANEPYASEPDASEPHAAEAEAAEAQAESAGDWQDAGGWQDPGAADADVGAHGEAADAAADLGTGELDVGELSEVATYGDDAREPDADVEAGSSEAARAAAYAPSERPTPARPAARPYPTIAREPGKLPSPHAFEARALTRPSLEPAWSPEPALRPDPAQSSGYFDYEGGVPRPAHPPRPEIDASQRVVAAPRPGAPWPRAQAAVVAAAAAVAVAAVSEPPPDAGFEELGVEESVASGDETAAVELPPEGEREEW